MPPQSSHPTLQEIYQSSSSSFSDEPVKLRRRKRPNSSIASCELQQEPATKVVKSETNVDVTQSANDAHDPTEEDFASMLESIEEAFDQAEDDNPNQQAHHHDDPHSRSHMSSSNSCAMSASSSPSFGLDSYSSSTNSPVSYGSMSPYSPQRESPRRGTYSPTMQSAALIRSGSSINSPSSSCSSSAIRPSNQSRWDHPPCNKCLLPILPTDLLSRVLMCLDSTSLCTLSRSCHSLRRPCHESRLWSTLYVRRWAPSSTRGNENWKEKYKQRELMEFAPMRGEDAALSFGWKILARALANRTYRQRDEFKIVDDWNRQHRLVWQHMRTQEGGVAGHGPQCGRDRCTYTLFPPDLWICNQTGWVHFCGPTSDEISQPLLVEGDKMTTIEEENVHPSQTSVESTHGPTASSSSSSSSSVVTTSIPRQPLSFHGFPTSAHRFDPTPASSAHPCAYLDPCHGSSSFHSCLRQHRSLPLLACPISHRPADERHVTEYDEDTSADMLLGDDDQRVRGGSPEPEESCGRGSFLASCFEHGYNSESIDHAAQIWTGINNRRHTTQTRTSQLYDNDESDTIQRGHLFGFIVDSNKGR